jgi:Fur family ferric uptake transcriptional regulator
MKPKVRNTPAKRFVLARISALEKAISQRELQEMSDNTFDRVTLYRVLERLVGEGMLHRATDKHGVVRYASCNHEHNGMNCSHHHLHFHCESCDEVSCLDQILPDFHLPQGYSITHAQFTIAGTCQKCSGYTSGQ